jgi:hypothetical protein
MAINLNSACNCCAESLEVPAIFSIFICALEYRSKAKSLNRCGFLDSGNYYFKEIITYTSPLEGGEGFSKINAETGETEQWNGETLVHVKIFVFNTSTFECDFSETGYFPEDFGSFDPPTFSYEDEYTDGIFLSNFELIPFSEFGEWDLFSEPPAATKTISDFRLNQSIIEARIVHKPSISGYLKVWFWLLREEVLEEDVIWTYQQAGSYEWFGPIPNTNSISSDENIIYGEPIEVVSTELNEGSTITIRKSLVIAKFSFLQGYEPSDPIFNTENGRLTRIENDCQSEGFPRTIIGGGSARPEFTIISDNPNCATNV